MTCRIAGGVWLLLLGAATAAWATGDEGITVNGDHVEYHEQARRIIGTGHIVATCQETVLTCDRAVIYLASKDALLSGRVRITQPGAVLLGEEILYNFETRKGSVLRAVGLVEPWRAVGDRLDKAADSGFIARHGYVTTCEFESPHTRVKARQIRVIPGDRVLIKHAVVYLGPVPVMYVPSYVHRLDDRRPRVALTPGYSKEWGPFLLSSWRYYLHENLQGRILWDWRDRRHFAEGVETRYRAAEDNQGIVRTYYTHEHRIDKGYRSLGIKKTPTEVQERYRVQWRHRWELDRDTTATLEYHQAKDEHFLNEYFRREYEQDAHPKTYFQLQRSDPRYAAALLVRKRVNRFEAETQQLPEVRYNIRPTTIAWSRPWMMLMPWLDDDDRAATTRNRPASRWYYQSDSSYDGFFRAPAHHGLDARVGRFDTMHQVSYAQRLFGAVNVTPVASFRETWYSRGALEERAIFRQAAETGVDVSTRVFRLFDVDSDLAGLDIHRLRHVIAPSVSYRYRPRPNVASRHFVQFDSIDAIDVTNILTPQIEQLLQTKRAAGGRSSTIDLARFVLGTEYRFKTRLNKDGGRLGDVTAGLELKPYSWLLVEHHAAFSTHAPHHDRFRTVDVDVVAGPGASYGTLNQSATQGMVRRDVSEQELPWAVGLGWRWQRDVNAQLTGEAIANVGPKWRIGVYERMDVRRINSDGSKFVNRPAESELRIRRDLHEWTVEFILSRRRAEGNLLLLLFRLKAFPEQPLEFERTYNRPKLGTRRPLFAG